MQPMIDREPNMIIESAKVRTEELPPASEQGPAATQPQQQPTAPNTFQAVAKLNPELDPFIFFGF
jgi:hypothetical protein